MFKSIFERVVVSYFYIKENNPQHVYTTAGFHFEVQCLVTSVTVNFRQRNWILKV